MKYRTRSEVHIGVDAGKRLTGISSVQFPGPSLPAHVLGVSTIESAAERATRRERISWLDRYLDVLAGTIGSAMERSAVLMGGPGSDAMPHHYVNGINIEDWAAIFRRGPGSVAVDPYHVEITARAYDRLSRSWEHLGVRVRIVAPIEAKRAVGVESQVNVKAWKAAGRTPAQIARLKKDAVLNAVLALSDLGERIDGARKPEKWALADATAIAFAGFRAEGAARIEHNTRGGGRSSEVDATIKTTENYIPSPEDGGEPEGWRDPVARGHKGA